MTWFLLYLAGLFATIAVVGGLDAVNKVPWNVSRGEEDSAVPKVMVILFWPVALAVLLVWAAFVGPYRLGRWVVRAW